MSTGHRSGFDINAMQRCSRDGGREAEREAMGGGDIKLAVMLGVFVGWQGILMLLFIASILASLNKPAFIYLRLP